ncbi:uncharacterized protein LDX57_002478 [Aspergillus melleus]|uniref:uncharacterized protein n=1 Tax=Aspergillus melleus TaxID=138277 RepID=UPI001E8E942A|nr:uncharacterized protein LDX57_002478 [Aspergillus melleus]KAH8424734.1 hypothetical protein LDX57_002478 [Aspergillus melleus]
MIEKAGPIFDAKLASMFMDCLLRSDAPVTEMARLVKMIIRTLHTSPSPHLDPQYFRTVLPRYLRVLFQLSLDAKDDALAESVLDQTLVLVRDAHQSSPPPYTYPNEEIQWMSTVGFNRAVEFYRASRDEEFQRWVEKAIALADLIDGIHKGELGGLLRRNFARLT